MKTIFRHIIIVGFLCFGQSIRAQIPAFPGAEGFGAQANGGRGGDVYTVVNLNNNGAGSLRYGLDTAPAAGRTIVFAVSGYIPVNSDTNFQVPSNVTIAGQTAPGDGVGLKGGRMLVIGNDVVMRHFRIRHGKYGTGGDCLNINSGLRNIVLDHISMMFSTDENISFFKGAVDDFTMQYSSSSWGMERHNAGGLWDMVDGTSHHSLWAHHRTRNPKARPTGTLEWINNVTYHWRSEGFIMGDTQSRVNYHANVEGCYFLSIDDWDFGLKSKAFSKGRVRDDGKPNFHLYLDRCLHDADGDGLLNGTDKGYAIVDGTGVAYPTGGYTPGDLKYYQYDTPFTGAPVSVTVDDPLTAYKKVISSVGPLRLNASFAGPLRDELDDLLIHSVENQDSILVAKDSPVTSDPEEPPSNGEYLLAQLYGISNDGFGTLNNGVPPTDSDGDGMPDDWELALGSNVAVQNHNTVFANNGAIITASTFFPPSSPAGYTYLEEYLHFCAIPHIKMAKNTAAQPNSFTVDLSKYTRGFTNSPVCTISGAYNGTFQQTGSVVEFTPTQNFSGRAGFNFNVTDADGSSWSQQFAILVTLSSVPRDIVWIGGNNGNAWDTSTLNWVDNATAATAFSDGDGVLFDDRGNNAMISVTGTRTPQSITVTGSKNYHFSGSGSLNIISTLNKSSASTLNISRPLSTASGTLLNGGETIINSGGNISGGAVEFTGGSTLTDNTGTGYLTFTPDIKVSEGAVGNFHLSQRINIEGSFSGGGTFNIYSPSTLGDEGRVYLKGASAGCTGTVNLIGGGTGRIAFYANGGSFNGFDNARVHLNGIELYTRNNSSGNTYAIGSLSGNTGAKLIGSVYAGPCTWNVGGLGLDSEFAGTIPDGPANINHLNKYGNGTLTLSGHNTYTGNTAIYDGTLRVLGSLGNTAVYVGTDAKLTGSGAVGNLLTIQSDGELSPGDEPGATGTMTVGSGLTLNSPTMRFDLSDSPAGDNDKITLGGGILTMSGTQTYQFNLTAGQLSAGTYVLVEGGDNTSASGVGFVHNLPDGGRQTFSLQRPASGNGQCYTRLVVSGNPASLVWKGNNGSNWDTSTVNWLNGATPDYYYNFDDVVLDDTAGTGNINIAGPLQPRSMLINNTTLNYTLSGGMLDGTMGLTKRGSGSLTINNSFGHTGGTTIEGGTVVLASNSSLGQYPVTLSGGALQGSGGYTEIPLVVDGSGTYIAGTGNHTYMGAPISGSGSLTIQPSGYIYTMENDLSGFAGTIALAGTGSLRLNQGGYTWGNPDCTFDLGASARLNNRATTSAATVYLGALSGGTGAVLEASQQSSGSGLTDTYVVGGLDLDTTFSGSMVDGATHALKILKTGTGTLTLAGSSTFTGGITVNEGELKVNGSSNATGAGTLLIQSGAALSGYGEVSGPATIEDGATLSPGDGVGSLSFADGLTLNEYTRLEFELGTNSDLVVVSGDLLVAGELSIADAGGFGVGAYPLFIWNPEDHLTLGAVSFQSMPAGYEYNIDTSIAGLVQLVVASPEPANISAFYINGSEWVMGGTGGIPLSQYYVLATTNLMIDRVSWDHIGTNQFDEFGAFLYTNSVLPEVNEYFISIDLP